MLRWHDEASGGTRLLVDRRYRDSLCKPLDDAVTTNDADAKHNDWPEQHGAEPRRATGGVANRGSTR